MTLLEVGVFFFFLPLQQACGFEYTSKLQRMFQDIGVSKDLNDKFKSHLTNTGALDCELSFFLCLCPLLFSLFSFVAAATVAAL